MPRVLIPQFRGISAAFLLALLPACASAPHPMKASLGIDVATAELGDLTTQLHEDMLLRHKMDRFATIASEDYVVMIPGGRIEAKQRDIDGAKNFNVSSVKFSEVIVHAHGTSAVVTGKWSIVGRLGQQEMSGDYDFMSFYEHLGGKWILVSEAVTRHSASMAAALTN